MTSASGLSATSNAFTLSVTDRNGVVPSGPAVWTWGEQVCTYSCAPPTTSTVSTPTTTTTPDQVVTTPGTTTTTTTSCTILGGQQYCGTVDPTTGQVTNYQPTYQSKPGTTTTTAPGTTTVIPGTTTVTYTTSTVTTPGTCSGRQLQWCDGEGCEARVRGCDAPYTGGDTSYPVGTVATSCQNPSISPSEAYCPMPAFAPSGPGTTTPPADQTPPEGTPPSSGGSTTPAPAPGPAGKWWYYNYFVQTKHTNGFVVNWYRLQCYVGSAQADSSQCGAPPTAIGSCQINGYGQGTCGTGVPFTDGVTQTSVVASTAGWFN